ncbi:MAG: hypothetical protein IIC89_02870 [Chloroflexi bacterium]|nr:hypothetical protein [Chloroflexota bacterium]
MPFPVLVIVSMGIAAATMAAVLLLSRRPLLAAGAGLLGAMALLIFHGFYFDHYSDDAYITLRYSRHLADGLGPNWNSTGRVEGFTTFAWMGVLAGTAKLGADLVDASRALAFLSLAATFGLVVLIWRLWSSDEPATGIGSAVLPAAVLLALALTDGVAFWGFSGMETPLFMALITGSALLYFRERRGGGLPLSAVAVAATAMTRPEGMIVAAITGGFVLADAASRLRSGDAEERRAAIVRALSWGTVFLALFGTYFVWRYAYYGYLFPNTYYAKVEISTRVVTLGLSYIASNGIRYQLLAMFGGALVLLAAPKIRRDAAYVIVLSAAMLTGVALEGGDAFAYGRFIVPIVPLLFLAGLSGFAMLVKRVELAPQHSTAVVAIVLLLSALLLISTSFNPHQDSARQAQADRQAIGEWMNEHTPDHYTIAAFAIGAVAYYASDRDVLDLLGINDVVIAHTEVADFGYGIPGHERFNIDYVLDVVRPEIIIPLDAQARPRTTEELRAFFTGESPVAARGALLTDPRLWEQYEARSLDLDGRWFNFLQLKELVGELQAPGLR